MLDRLFSRSKVVDSALEGAHKVGGWFDRLSFTEEEMAEHGVEIFQLKLKFMKAAEPFRVAQRRIATIVMTVWAITAVSFLYAMFTNNVQLIEYLTKFASSQFMWVPASLVMGFYFFGGTKPGSRNEG